MTTFPWVVTIFPYKKLAGVTREDVNTCANPRLKRRC